MNDYQRIMAILCMPPISNSTRLSLPKSGYLTYYCESIPIILPMDITFTTKLDRTNVPTNIINITRHSPAQAINTVCMVLLGLWMRDRVPDHIIARSTVPPPRINIMTRDNVTYVTASVRLYLNLSQLTAVLC